VLLGKGLDQATEQSLGAIRIGVFQAHGDEPRPFHRLDVHFGLEGTASNV
jgi:hypothetical protein